MEMKGPAMHLLKACFTLVSLGILANTPLYSQTRSELEQKKKNTQEEIEYTNSVLEETRKNRLMTVNRVNILNTRIRLRNELVQAINQEIALIEQSIEDKASVVESLESDLNRVKLEYEKLIIYAYWNKSNKERIMFVLSAESFNQAYKRLKYIQQFTRHRKEQALLIKELQNNIVEEIEALEETIVQKEALILEKRNENRVLQRERSESNTLVNTLRNRERELRNKIAEKKRVADRLEKEISEIIAEEARKRNSRNIYQQLTPEEKLISDNFSGNKGKLPWPTERGVITGKYGRHRHPVLKQVTVQNDGIDISTVQGAEARAIFEGVVSKVVAILGSNNTVIIRHGNFLTVYQNLVDVRVKKGDQVAVKQVLGRIFTEQESGSTTLHVEIWKEMDKQNPEEWLSKRN
jgi:septal ring factor EnvC (AmiA/AmiB activator)